MPAELESKLRNLKKVEASSIALQMKLSEGETPHQQKLRLEMKHAMRALNLQANQDKEVDAKSFETVNKDTTTTSQRGKN